MNRIRSKDLTSGGSDNISTTLGYTYFVKGETGSTPVLFSYRDVVGSEYMFDSTDPVLSDRPVEHAKLVRTYHPIPLTYWGGGGSPPTGSWTQYPDTRFGQSNTWGKYNTFGLYDPISGSVDGLTPLWPNNSDDQVVQKLYKLARQPVMEGLVNVVEADQLPGSLKSMGQLLQGIHMPRRFSLFQKALRGVSVGSRRAASSYLAYQFGLAPLMSDMKSTCQALNNIGTSMEKFVAGQTLYKASVSTVAMSGTANLPTSVPNAVWSNQLRLTLRPTLRYTLAYRYKRFLADTFVEKPLFLARKFGFLDPAEIVWELIPFSFVVDWFVDTSGLLARMDDAIGLDPIETISCVKSKKWQGETDVFRTVFGYNTTNVVWTAKAATTAYSWYKRSPLGRTTYVGPSKRFGNKQMLLSIALARQRLRA